MKQGAALLIPHFCASEPEALGSGRAALLTPHYQASEPEVLGEAAGPSRMLAMLIPHYRAFEPEVLGEAVGCFADPAFLCLGA